MLSGNVLVRISKYFLCFLDTACRLSLGPKCVNHRVTHHQAGIMRVSSLEPWKLPEWLNVKTKRPARISQLVILVVGVHRQYVHLNVYLSEI